jgi:hypothetical protein
VAHEALEAALGRSFDPAPRTSELAKCHRPYALLTGRDVEAELRRALGNYGRIGVTGVSGSGKSSLVRYATDLDERLAPIYLNVAAEDHDKVRDPRGFPELLITHLVDTASDAAKLTDEHREELLRDGRLSRPIRGIARTRRAEFGGNWLLTGKIAEDIALSVPAVDGYRNLEQLAATANLALAHVQAHDRVPVIVADDTDRFLRLPNTDTSALFNGFFGEVLRALVAHLGDFALVVAVHDQYRTDTDLGYDTMVAGILEDHFPVPPLETPAHIEQVLDMRAAFVERDIPEPYRARDLFTNHALEELAMLHVEKHRHDLRHTLTTAKSAIAIAVDDPADLVDRRHVQAAEAS